MTQQTTYHILRLKETTSVLPTNRMYQLYQVRMVQLKAFFMFTFNICKNLRHRSQCDTSKQCYCLCSPVYRQKELRNIPLRDCTWTYNEQNTSKYTLKKLKYFLSEKYVSISSFYPPSSVLLLWILSFDGLLHTVWPEAEKNLQTKSRTKNVKI